ncbi:hypothetical protein IW261DRAFT_1533238 [Armillaria novae-zelandiae]|uniref:Uncharacterized protein n=1 Tax=Armillaria novae-zelandiae TaxID=153914 RepID=A0AA39TVD4_9AGAR|nr:hypothetical protein IW261DRAFT_1533238 [Armillaria novae-zelandiae]
MDSSETGRKSQMAFDQFRRFFRQEQNPSMLNPPTLLNSDGALTLGSELSIALYGTETVNANDPNQLVYDLYTHETPSADEDDMLPCTETCFNFHLTGTVHVTTVPACHSVISSSDISTDIRHKYPTPMWAGHRYYVPFEAAYTTSLGVSMNRILHGSGSCLQYPGQYPKALAGLPFIDVVFHSNGYLPQYIRIAAKCSHVTGMRYVDVAYSVSLGYRTILRREASKISPSRTDEGLPLVTDEEHLKLMGLYSRDRRVWWAEVAICG